MDITIILILTTGFYAILMFFDMFFKSCMHYPYIQYLKGTGLQIKFFQIQWTTTIFNRFFLRCGYQTRFLNNWFLLGLYITLTLLPLSVLLLLFGIGQSLFLSNNDENLIIEPIIPGVNTPSSELGYYSLSLIICTIVHEFGHALAAVIEDVHIINVGFNLFFVLPVAYVNLSSDNLNSLNVWKRLKILTAGIWHNLVLIAVAYLIYSILPFCYSAAFRIDEGVKVTYLSENSPLLGGKGFELDDIITRINNCQVKNEYDFKMCLIQARNEKIGYCVETDMVHNLDESVQLRQTNTAFDCCPHGKEDGICFEYIEKTDGVMEIPPHACLPARIIIETSQHHCKNSVECPDELHCLKPLLENNTSLFKISRVGKAPVIYIGHPSDIFLTVKISSYIPKYSLSKHLHPDVMLKFLEYLIVISFGLALINVIPCLFMDGQHIIHCLAQMFTKDSKPIAMAITLLFTILLMIHCIHSIYLNLK
ncbi:PREDICTED: membrane-bound transcription factor site-2 protease [Nicrophorus vespilloides]|uniref:Membrane-bound transcription factor site-2 protease n=1 Tax=Nicrophorus vespilloides TaxID=110193 RepID=A0ABM1MLA5_NICVS|nr:PREDICTED: membrane-bound transcription factor site-2 protease [Nicrophorus vespilloides]